MSQISAHLIDDHGALDKILKQLQTAIRSSDVESVHAQLDLFWARLAVHIRAEHLHLFPAVNGLGEEAQKIITELRQDHEFFMHELARAVETNRELLTTSEQPMVNEGLKTIENIVGQIEQRLVQHNEVEENKIYHWASTLLSDDEQTKLTERITWELRNRPSRFTDNTWSDT